MKIKIKYFASLRESANKVDEDYTIDKVMTLREIYEDLARKYSFSLAFSQISCAINNEYANESSLLKEGDVLVFIPPVAGG